VWWHAHWSEASGHSGARKLTGGGGKERGECGGPFSCLIEARAVVWWLSDSDEAVVEEELSSGSAQAWREGVKGAGRIGGGGSLL
jgi:hypothetical protein